MNTLFIKLAREQGILALKGNEFKAGPFIEKYLSVFRPTLAQRDSQYLNTCIGYDWCCAYVYYLLKQVNYNLNVTPLFDSNWTLAAVKT